MGLDVGDKRIGIAFSDPLRITAQGHSTYNRTDEAADVSYLMKLYAEFNCEKIACGFPKNMNNTVGPQAEKVMAFADKLKGQGAVVEYVDERLTTAFAERNLIEADMRRDKRKLVIDKMAAVAILQGHLDTIGRK